MRWIGTLLVAVGLLCAGCSSKCERAAARVCAGVVKEGIVYEECLGRETIRCEGGFL